MKVSSELHLRFAFRGFAVLHVINIIIWSEAIYILLSFLIFVKKLLAILKKRTTTATPRTTPREKSFIFYRWVSEMPRSVLCLYRSRGTCSRLISNASVQFQIRKYEILAAVFLVLQKYAELFYFAKKCTKMYNARSQQLICSLCRCRRVLLKVPNTFIFDFLCHL